MADKELLITGAEKRTLLEWNDTFREYPLHKCLHELIQEQVCKTPEKPAVRFGTIEFSYSEFNNRANRCASYLKSIGIGPDSIVGVLMERSAELPIALLGILKAGGAYLPLDPAYPEERLRFMLEDAEVSVILTQEKFSSIVRDFDGIRFYMDSQWEYLSQEPDTNPENTASPDSLAYIIYTSGSTGKPKGCMLQHKAICNRLLWMQEKYRLTEMDRVLQKTPFTFDVSVWEFFWPLLSGACLVIARPGGHKDSNYIIDIINNEKITTCHFVPSMLRFFTGNANAETCHSLRQVFTSGEALSYDLMKDFKRKLDADLHNLYGPTEAAVDVAFWNCGEREDLKVPIGRPISNIQLYILDSSLRQVPIGQEGELHIGGIGLALGYLNRPELTSEKFIDNPYGTEAGAKLYKTGDNCRYLSDGNIEFLGRIDFQVKLRGNRIELGEIEATLREHENIEDAVAVVQDEHGADPKLAAYIVFKGDAIAPGQLRAFAKSRLPEYMVPNIFVRIDSLPVGQHGKLERKALPWPIKEKASEMQDTTENSKEAAFKHNMLKNLLDFIENAAGIYGVNEESDLFDIGATSLTMAQMVEKIQKDYGVQVPVDVFLDQPNIKAVTDYVCGRLEEAKNTEDLLKAQEASCGVQVTGEQNKIRVNKSKIVTALIGFIAGGTGLEGVKAEDDLFDIGATSLSMAQLIENIQLTYGVAVPVDIILENATISAVAEYVSRQLAIASEEESTYGRLSFGDNKSEDSIAYDAKKAIRLKKAVFKEAAYKRGGFRREFAEKTIPFDTFCGFLSLLRTESIESVPKYLHPTAGGLNALQTYVYLNSGAVEGLERGIYYYHPEEHALYIIYKDAVIDEGIFFEYDRPVFRNARFVLFFIAQLDAITPVYQGASPSLVTVDAGYIGQLLLDRQNEFNLGICPVEGVDFDSIAAFFKLDGGHRFIHCMLGGMSYDAQSLPENSEKGQGLVGYLQKTGRNINEHINNYTGSRTFSAFLDFNWKSTLKSMKYLTKEEHDIFNSRHLNIRKFPVSEKSIPLKICKFRPDAYLLRSCRRDYAEKTVSFEEFGKFMTLLSHEQRDSVIHSLYPSVSGTFDVKVYIYIKENRVEGFGEGIYRYDPLNHELEPVTLSLTKKIKPSYTPFNRKQYQQSAFCIFLLGKAGDWKSFYGEDSMYFNLLEAGYIGQLLMDRQSEFNIGICPIGGLDFERIRPDFGLEDNYELLHSFTCGVFEQEIPVDRDFIEVGRGGEEEVTELRNTLITKKRLPVQLDMAIIGVSGRYPGARNMDEFWKVLKEGRSVIGNLSGKRRKLFSAFGNETAQIPESAGRGGYIEDIDSFDSLLFNISPSEARITDPQERLFLETAWECLENAGYTAESLVGASGRIGVFVGAMWNDYQNGSSGGNVGEVKPTAFHSSIANRASYFFNFDGPSIALNTSCSSAMTAIHFACESIKRGECDAALVGGVNLLTHPYHHELLLGLDMLSKDGKCRPLGANATGWVAAEGVAAILIKPLEDAERDHDYIHGIIKGTSLGHSGKSMRFGAPNTAAQEQEIKTALENAGISAADISYIEAAAAGSVIADASEINAIKKVFEGQTVNNRPIRIGSVKGCIGHAESASAMSQLSKVLLQIKHRSIAASVNSSPVNPLIALEGSCLEIADSLIPWNSSETMLEGNGQQKTLPLRALINAFGATGSGGHIVIEEYIYNGHRQEVAGDVIIPLSAATEEQLDKLISSFYNFLKNSCENLYIEDISYTLRTGRTEMEERLAIVAGSLPQLEEKLGVVLAGGITNGIYRGRVMSGQNKADTHETYIYSVAQQWVTGVAINWEQFNSAGARRVPLPTYPFAKASHWYEAEAAPASVDSSISAAPQNTSEDSQEIVNGLRSDAENYLRTIFSQASEIPRSQINITATLDRYGINSIMIAKLNDRLEKDFGELPKILFFEYHTLQQITEYFLNNHRDKLYRLFNLSGQYKKTPEGIAQSSSTFASVDRKEDNVEEIAIIGLSGKYPKASTLEEFWENLKNGLDCITEIPRDRWDYKEFFDSDKRLPGKVYSKWGGFIDNVDKFDPLFFNISPREAEIMDPQERLFLETAWNTIEDSGYNLSSLREVFGGNIGVFAGVMYGEYQLWNDLRRLDSEHLSVVSSYGSIANRVSYNFDFHGPSMAVDTLCSSSLTAIHLAVESIRRGECEAALAGGVNISIHPAKYIVQSQMSMSSTDGRCRSFGEGGDGFVPGEGVGAVFLKPYHKAVKDGDHIYGVIKASTINHGGKTNGYTVPNPAAQSSLILNSLIKAGIDACYLSYIEAHGTGTSLGDPIEISALSKCFSDSHKKQFCPVGSVKSNIGHLESAAGIAGLTKVLLQMKYKKLVPSLHSKQLNRNIDFSSTPFYVQQELTDWNQPEIEVGGIKHTIPRIASVSAFGAGGANAHIIIEEYTDELSQPRTESAEPQIIVLSARDEDRLKCYAAKLIDCVGGLKAVPDSLRSMAYTLQTGREALDERLALVVSSLEELEEKLVAFAAGKDNIENLYYGCARRNKDIISVFGDDDDLRRTVDLWLDKGKYDKAAELWSKGINLDWIKLYDDKKPLRISLPAYPFAGKRYWINDNEPEKAGTVFTEVQKRDIGTSEPIKNDGTEIMTFEEIWEEQKIEKTLPVNIKTLVCFISRHENQEAVKTEVKAKSPVTNIVFISQGTEFQKLSEQQYVISITSEEQYLEAFRAIQKNFGEMDVVLYMWASEKPDCIRDYSGIIYLLKTIAILKFKKTKILLAAGLKGSVDDCYAESWIGFERSLGLVLPGVKLAVVFRDETQSGSNPADWIDIVWRELGVENESVLYRGERRFVYRVEPVVLEKGDSPVRSEGTYLITGGCGKLGYLLAEHLSETVAVKLILTGRKPENEEIRQKLSKLEESGSRVLYLSCDISDAAAMEEGLKKARTVFGRINGVIHAAGIMGGKSILENDIYDFWNIINPKINGALVLDNLLREEPLDFICYFSSSSAVLGDFGSCDYAVANRFLTAYANYQNRLGKKRNCRIAAIQWPVWKDGGMGKGNEENIRMYLKSSGQRFLNTDEGIELFEMLLSQKRPIHLVLVGHCSRIESFLGISNTVTVGEPYNVPGAAVKDLRSWKEGLNTEQCVECDLKSLISKILKIPEKELDTEENFADFGFDSISLIEYAQLLTELYNIEISPALFYGYSTVKRLAQYYVNEHTAVIEGFYRDAPYAINNTVESGTVKPAVAQTSELPLPDEKAAELENGNTAEQPIAIIGMSGRFPKARNIYEMWDMLSNGQNAVEEIPVDRFDWKDYYGDPVNEPGKTNCKWCGCIPGVREFDAAFFDISPREAVSMDPRQRLLLQESWKALEDAGYGEQQINSGRIGMFVGAEQGDYVQLSEEDVSITSNNNAILAARLAYFLNLNGPVLTIDTACSSGLVAVHQACMSLRNDECDMALAAGVNLLLAPKNLVGMGQAGMLSSQGKCYTFDRRADGIVPGEAVAALVLKPLSTALRDGDPIYAVIRGSGINFDGKTNGITAPNGVAQASLLKSVYDRYRINPEDIEYIVTHGTGTRLGDPVEVNALSDTFKAYTNKKGYCALTSAKTNFGHSMGSSGIVSLVSLVQSLRHETIPASINFEQENEFIGWKDSPFYVNTKNRHWPHVEGKKRVGAVSSFGMSGTNAHVVVESYYENNACVGVNNNGYLLAFSAKTAEGLRENIRSMLYSLQSGAYHDEDLRDISYTLLLRRYHFCHRCAVIAKDINTAIEALKKAAVGEDIPNVFKGTTDKGFAADETKKQHGQDILNQIQQGVSGENSYVEALSCLAELYSQGYTLQWEKLFTEGRPKTLHLPTYSFAKELYWVPEARKKAERNTFLRHTASYKEENKETDEEKPKNISLRSPAEDMAVNDSIDHGNIKSAALKLPGSAWASSSMKTGFQEHFEDQKAKHIGTQIIEQADIRMQASSETKNTDSALPEELRRMLAEALYIKSEDIGDAKQFVDIGMDSIIGVEWIRSINKKYGVSLAVTRIYDYPTILEFSKFLAAELEKRKSGLSSRRETEHRSSDTSVAIQRPAEISLLASARNTQAKMPDSSEGRYALSAEVLSEGYLRVLQEELKKSFAEALYIKFEDVGTDKQFSDMGMDSIIGVEWIRGINKKYGISLATTRLYDYPTISEFGRFLAKELDKTSSSKGQIPGSEIQISTLREMLEKVQNGTLSAEHGNQLLNQLKKQAG